MAADIDTDGAIATATLGEAEGAPAAAVTVDIADETSVTAMVEAAVDALGRVDVLVNNAALYAGVPRKPFYEIDIADWDRVLAVNLKGPWLCANACFPVLPEGGAIVNISSASVLSGSPLFAHYTSSKGGLIALTRVMAREAGERGIRVNAVAPGFTLTDASRELFEDPESYGVDRAALKRPAYPEDVVGAVLFLASDASAFITGQTLVVDGGRQFL